MCGEIDDDVLINSEIQARLLTMAHKLGVEVAETSDSGPGDLTSEAGRVAYMDHLFHDGLTRVVKDVNAAEDVEKVDALASQAIAFARLAGFIAGQLPAEADLFRATIEALTAGHSEPRQMAEEHHRNHRFARD